MRGGEPWFVASDVARALGYADPSRAVVEHCKKSIKSTTLVTNRYGKPTPLNQSLIPESDVYRLVFRSRLKAVEKFQAWICEEVLPQIRKTGGYGQVQKPLPQTYLEALKALVAAEEEKLEAQELAAKALEQNETLREIVGCATEWKQVKAIPWIGDFYDTGVPAVWSQLGKALKRLSDALGVEVRKCQDSQWGMVNMYHIKVIEVFRQQTENNPSLLAEYRKC